MNDLHTDPKHPRSTPLFSKDDVRDMLALLPDTRRETDPEDLESFLAETGRLLNETHPMPAIQAPDKARLAVHTDEPPSPKPIAIMHRHWMNNGVALLAMAASFALGLILFRAPSDVGPADPIVFIEDDHRTRTAPPHPEALAIYDREATDALLDRAVHLMVLWHFHQNAWYLQEALRNLLEALRYQPEDARVADALTEVYKELKQPDKVEEYRQLAEELRAR